MSIVSTFRNYLHEQQFIMEEIQDEDGGIFFRTRQNFNNGGTVILIVSFNKSEDIVDLQSLNIANIDGPLKKESLLKLINELNSQYRYTKFTEENGRVDCKYSLATNEKVFDPSHIFDTLVMLYNSAQDTYPKFMKLQWA